MTLASWITLSRIILVIPTVWLLGAGHYGWVLCLILISALTDYLDGLAARKLNQISDVGKVLDQVADKIFVNSVFIVMAVIGSIPSWFAVVTNITFSVSQPVWPTPVLICFSGVSYVRKMVRIMEGIR